MKSIIMTDGDEISVGPLINYYGTLLLKYEGGKYYCSITDWDGNHWNEVPNYLAEAMIRFEQEYRNEWANI